MLFHWQNQSIGKVRKPAFGINCFISGVASNYGMIEIGSATRSCQLLFMHPTQPGNDFHIEIDTSTNIVTSTDTLGATEVETWTPGALTATVEFGRMTSDPEAGVLSTHFKFVDNADAGNIALGLGEIRWPIVAQPGELVRVQGLEVAVNVGAQLAWVEF